jgi:putative DNA primase/helicase
MSRRAFTLEEILGMEPEPEQHLLEPLITKKSIGMIAGPRGMGKSFLALFITYATAAEKMLLPWGRGGGEEVVYLDGEMRFPVLRERLAKIHSMNTKAESIKAVRRRIHIISRDLYGSPIGSIDSVEGQERIAALIPSSASLIIIDNLSAWTGGGREDASAWAVIKSWLIEMKLRGTAILLIHHTGKNGQQRGSSAHEDLLDYSILLRPANREVDPGKTQFIIQHTKLRDHVPELRQDFLFVFGAGDGEAFTFGVTDAEEPLPELAKKILALYNGGIGMTQAEIAKKLEVHKSTVSRVIKKAGRKEGEGGSEQ